MSARPDPVISFRGLAHHSLMCPVMRPAIPADIESVLGLLDQAFAPCTFESSLVRALVMNGRNLHHWLLEKDRQVLAYVCYSPAYRGQEPVGWHLAPVAVHPEWQRKGLGTDLIWQSLARSPISGKPVFVLGDPEYYPRFGFCRVQEPRCPFDSTNEHFMALRYAGHDSFIIGYKKDFSSSEQVAPPKDSPAQPLPGSDGSGGGSHR